ncbi:hypothetical protein JNG39_13265 [Luteibacter sp. CQ10]
MVALLGVLALISIALYVPGLSGGFVFDDYPNIVDNTLVQPAHGSISELVAAALSSPSSELKRPLASLSFALNYLASGLDAPAMKATNLSIHVACGWLLFALMLRVFAIARRLSPPRTRMLAAAGLALAWLVLPINLTAVLYVVQRMESTAQLCVLAGLLGYVTFRQRQLRGESGTFALTVVLLLATVIGVAFKETAILLPLYACAMEWILFRFRNGNGKTERGIVALFVLVLLLPMLVGLAVILPRVLSPGAWATRDFTLETRLLSEPRVILDYVVWTLVPSRQGLSFYHDDFLQSTGLLTPWTTLASICTIFGALVFAIAVRRRRPLMALGLLWFFACHTLTATIVPLELIYEHRNYPASIGLLMALCDVWFVGVDSPRRPVRAAVVAAGCLLVAYWSIFTARTAYAWRAALPLAAELAERAPTSPRAQYEYGRALIIASHYKPESSLVEQARVALQRSASLPGSSVLPEQALIFLNARMSAPIKDAWWESMYRKLATQRATVQDDSSLLALDACVRSGACLLPADKLTHAFELASRDGNGSARLVGAFAQYAWSVLGDRERALTLSAEAVQKAPDEPAYRINYANLLISAGRPDQARNEVEALRRLNLAGRLDADLATLDSRLSRRTTGDGSSERR